MASSTSTPAAKAQPRFVLDEFIATALSATPADLHPFFQAFSTLYTRKLWHQLTLKLFEFFDHPSAKPYRVDVFERFVRDFEGRINQLRLVEMGVKVAKDIDNPQVHLTFLTSLLSRIDTETSKEAHVLLQASIAHAKLLYGDLEGTKNDMDEAWKILDALDDVDTGVNAAYYGVAADYYKAKAEYAPYYRNSLLYLACVDVEKGMSAEERLLRAHDLGVSALLGDTIYNFGELLMHPILDSLNGTQHEWLKRLLLTFNEGNIGQFEALAPLFPKEPILQANYDFLRQKICLMALIESVFQREPHKRTLSFATIAHETRLPENEVEHLVMKALSLKLIKGSLDEVERRAVVTWVQPRVLSRKQIGALAGRLEAQPLVSMQSIHPLKHRRVSLADADSPRLAHGWTFRDDTVIDAQQPDRKGKARRTDRPPAHTPDQPPASPVKESAPTEKKPRKKWSEEETQTLIRGCQTHGVGNWKTILQDPNFKFHDRTAVDLKDRFRTYFPDAYKRHYPNAKTHLSSKVRSTLPDGTNLFEKTRSKRRRPFTEEEDRALKAGYEKYGTTWATIVKDPVFQEQNRRSTDLRDRFRNAFPHLYQLAGYKPRATVKKKLAAAEAAAAAAAASGSSDVVASRSAGPSSAVAGPSTGGAASSSSAALLGAGLSSGRRAVTDDHLDLSTGGLGPVRSRRRAQTNQGLLLRGGTKSVPQSTAPSEDEDSSAGEEESVSSQSNVFKTPPLPVFVDNVSTGASFSSTTALASKLKKLDVDPFIMMPTTPGSSSKTDSNPLDDPNPATTNGNGSIQHQQRTNGATSSSTTNASANEGGMDILCLDSLAEPLNIPDFLPSSAHSSLDNTPWSSGIDTPTHSSTHAWSTAAASPTSSHFSDYLMTNSSSQSSPSWGRKTELLGSNGGSGNGGDGMIGKSAWGAHDWFSSNPKLDHSAGSGRDGPANPNSGSAGGGGGAVSPVSPFSPASSSFQPLGAAGTPGTGSGQYQTSSFPGTPSAGVGNNGELSDAESDVAAFLGLAAAANPANLFLHNHHLSQQQSLDNQPSSSTSYNGNNNNYSSYHPAPHSTHHTPHMYHHHNFDLHSHHHYNHHSSHHGYHHQSIMNTPSSSAAFSPSSAFSDELFGFPSTSSAVGGAVALGGAGPSTSTKAYHSQIAGDLMIAGNTRMFGSAVGSGFAAFGGFGGFDQQQQQQGMYGGGSGFGGLGSSWGSRRREREDEEGGLGGALGLVGIELDEFGLGVGGADRVEDDQTMDQSLDGGESLGGRRGEETGDQQQNPSQSQPQTDSQTHTQSQPQSQPEHTPENAPNNGSSGNTLEEVGLTGMRLEDSELMEDVVVNVVGVEGGEGVVVDGSSAALASSSASEVDMQMHDASSPMAIVDDHEDEGGIRDGSPMPMSMLDPREEESRVTGAGSGVSMASSGGGEEQRGRQLLDGRRVGTVHSHSHSHSASSSPGIQHQHHQQTLHQHQLQQNGGATPSSRPFTLSDLVVDEISQDSSPHHQHHHHIPLSHSLSHSHHHHHQHPYHQTQQQERQQQPQFGVPLRRTYSDSNAILTDDEDDELHSTPPATPIISKPRPVRRSSGSMLHNFGHGQGGTFGSFTMAGTASTTSASSSSHRTGDDGMVGVTASGSGATQQQHGHHARSISVPPSEARVSTMMDGHGGIGLEGLDIAGYGGGQHLHGHEGLWMGLDGLGFGTVLGHQQQQAQSHQQQQQHLHQLHGTPTSASRGAAGFFGSSSSSQLRLSSTPTSPVSSTKSPTRRSAVHQLQASRSRHHRQSQSQSRTDTPLSHPRPVFPTNGGGAKSSNGEQQQVTSPSRLVVPSTSSSSSGTAASSASASGSSSSPSSSSPLASSVGGNGSSSGSAAASPTGSITVPSPIGGRTTPTPGPSSASSQAPNQGANSTTNRIQVQNHIGATMFRPSSAYMATTPTSLTSVDPYNVPYLDMHYYYGGGLSMGGGASGGAGSGVGGFGAQSLSAGGFGLVSLQQQAQQLQQAQQQHQQQQQQQLMGMPNVHTHTLNTLVGLHGLGDEFWLAQMEESRQGQALDLAQSAILASSSLSLGGANGIQMGGGGSGGGFGFGYGRGSSGIGSVTTPTSGPGPSSLSAAASSSTTPTSAASSPSSSAPPSSSSSSAIPSSTLTSSAVSSQPIATRTTSSTSTSSSAHTGHSASAGHTPPLGGNGLGALSPRELFASLKGIVDPNATIRMPKTRYSRAGIDKLQMTSSVGSQHDGGQGADLGGHEGGGVDRGKGASSSSGSGSGSGLGRSVSHHRGHSAILAGGDFMMSSENKRKRASWDGKLV